MMKRILSILGLVLVFVVGVIIALLLFVDVNAYKPQIEQAVEESTGRELTLGGEIGLSIFPLGVELGQVELANAEGFEEPVFARIESLIVKVDLISLISGELRVDALHLEGLWLFLEVDETGRNNWQDMAASDDVRSDDDTDGTEDTHEHEDRGDGLRALAISGIEILNADIQFDDRQAGQKLRVSEFELITDDISFGEPVAVSLSLGFGQEKAGESIRAQLAMDTELTIEASLQQFVLDALRIDIKTHMPAVQQEIMELGIATRVDIDLDEERVRISDADIDAVYAKLSLDASIRGWSDQLQIEGRIQSETLNPRELAYRFAADLPSMQGEKTLSHLVIDSTFGYDGTRASLVPKIEFDESRIEGDITVTPGDIMKLRYDISMDRIEIDRYMPPADGTENAEMPAEPVAGAEVDTEIPIPSELLRTLDVEGTFSLGHIDVMDIDIEELTVGTTVSRGVVELSPVSAKLLDGTLDSQTSIDVRSDVPVFTHELNLRAIHIGPVADPILETMIPAQQVAAIGSGNVTADMKTSGTRLSQLKQNSNGRFGFDFKDAKLDGLDVDHFFKSSVKAALEEKKNPFGLAEKFDSRYRPETKTAFDIMRANFDVRDGVANSNDLLMEGSKLKVAGTSTVDVNRMTTDTRITANRKLESVETNEQRLEAEPIPVRVYGDIAAPKFKVDYSKITRLIGRMVKEKATESLRKNQQEAEQKIDRKKKKVKDKLKNKFKGLLK